MRDIRERVATVSVADANETDILHGGAWVIIEQQHPAVMIVGTIHEQPRWDVICVRKSELETIISALKTAKENLPEE